MIEIHNLTKKFGNFTAVNDLSLQIQKGEVFGFLGVNGAGKTTTLKMLVGILRPTSGTIKIGGYDLNLSSREAKKVTGYIPDRPYIYPKLSGREFLHFVSDLYGISHKESNSRIDSLLEEYNLTEWQNELVENYSHGMKQRLATCGALIHRPKVLIVDEPMVGLDPHGAKLLKNSIKSYAHHGMTILLSTHSLHVAEEISDRLAIVHHGRLATSGTLEELRQVAGIGKHGLEDLFIDITTRPQMAHMANGNGIKNLPQNSAALPSGKGEL